MAPVIETQQLALVLAGTRAPCGARGFASAGLRRGRCAAREHRLPARERAPQAPVR